MSSCLDSSEIVGLLEGSLPEAQRAAGEEHLQACPHCQALWEERQHDAALFGEIRSAFSVVRTEPAGAAGSQPWETGDSLSGYELLEELHRGGQGLVYKAVQKATRRTVAVKVLLQGMHATVRQRQRFAREIDVAAQLRHPHIVTIFDSGEAAGRSFFAMEYIEGRRLDEHLQAGPRSVRQTLELFQPICSAVAYAHQHGVIHRDLKPGNILVTDEGFPFVLDFGLAKLADSTAEATAPLTHTGEFLGTLAYAAPEQTRGDPQLVDVRTDVYALGVILYEMLTGRLPCDVAGPLAETITHICQAEPLRPSLLRREVDQDLETLILKALAKEPERRYQSAEHLARDVGHYLQGQALDARRDSTWYVLGKTLRRHRWIVGTAAAFAVVIVTALVVALTLWGQAVLDRNRAQTAQRQERKARTAEAEQRAEAEFQACIANLAAAQAALRAHDVVDARLRLQRTPASLRNWEWGFLNSRLDASRRTLSGHTSYVEEVAFSPDGAHLASVSWDRTARVWQVETGRLLAKHEAPAELWSLAYHPNGRLIALGCWDGTVGLWNWSTGEIRTMLQGPAKEVWSVAFSPDGSLLAASFSMAGPAPRTTVIVWNSETAASQASFTEDGRTVRLAFHPDGRRLVTASPAGVRLRSAIDGAVDGQWQGSDQPSHVLALNRQGTLLATADHRSQIVLHAVEDGSLRHTLRGHRQGVAALAFSPDGRRLASASRDKTLRLWDLATGDELAVLCGHTWTVSTVAFHPKRNLTATGSWDQSIKLWDTQLQPRTMAQRQHTSGVLGLAVNAAGNRLASGGRDSQLILWDLEAGPRPLWRGFQQGPIQAVAFDPEGQVVASASWDATVALWSVATGERLRTLTGHADRVHALAFSPDGKRLVSGSRDNTLRIWDPDSGKLLSVVDGHSDHIHSVAWSQDGKWFASVGHLTLKVWDAATFTEAASFRRSIVQEDFSLAFHPDNRRLAAGSDVQTLSIWDVVARKEIANLRGHSDEIHSVAFTPDGTRLVSASFDRTVRIWDTATGTELIRSEDTESQVNCLTFDPSGRRLFLGRSDGSIVVWEGTPPERP